MNNLISKEETILYPYLDEPIKIYKLKNGHTIVLAKKEGELVNISTWVKTGSINENDKNNGVSHFLEHLMFKGTPSHPAGEFDRILEAKGAIVNAATWKDYTFYYVTLPKGENNKYFLETLDLHADMMLNPLLPEDEIGPVFDINNPEIKEKRERYVVIEEIRMRDDQPWTKTYNELNHNMYQCHPYKRDVIGFPEIIATIPRDEIMDYYKTWYSPQNMTTIIVGEIDFEETLELVVEKFNFKEEITNPLMDIKQEEEQTETRYIENKGQISTGFLMFGYHGSKACSMKDTITLDVISLIMGEGKSSRLVKNLIEKPQSPVFNILGTEQYHFRDGNTFFVQGNFNANKKEQALQQIKDEIEVLLKDGVTETELIKAKKRLKVRFADSVETVSDIGENIGYYMTVCDNLSMCSDYLPTLDTITLEDIHKAAQKYLALNKATISVLMPE